MALHIEVEPGDSIRIGPHTTVRMERKSGQRARLRIDSTEDIAQYKAGEAVPAIESPPVLPSSRKAPAKTTPVEPKKPVLRAP